MQDILDILKSKSIFKDVTNVEKLKSLSSKKVYIGFDPTAESLHLGNYVQIVVLRLFQHCGFEAYAVLGGATGMIGDPAGKTTERSLLSPTQLQKNKSAIKAQFKKFKLNVIDNYDFYAKLNVLDFLRSAGKLVNVGTMFGKEVVRARIEAGLSFTEFAYQLIQGWDFLKLYEIYGITVQVGGSDQWGNITTGIDMIHKKLGNDVNVVGITTSLLLKKDGQKFGKTSDGTVWLSPQLTPPFSLYQYLLNQPDEDIATLLNWFLPLPKEKIDEVLQNHFQNPKLKAAQQFLAKELLIDIHSQKDWETSVKLTNLLYGNQNFSLIGGKELAALEVAIPTLSAKKITLLDALLAFGIVDSRRAARELILNGAIKVNNSIITNPDFEIIKDQNFFDGKATIIKKGKKHNYLLRH